MAFTYQEIAFAVFLSILFLQSAAVAAVFWTIKRRLRGVDEKLGDAEKKASATLREAAAHLDRAVELSAKLPEWEERYQQFSLKTMETVRQGDEALRVTLERLRVHGGRFNHQLTRGVQSFSRHSFQVHQAVLHPTRRISAALEAIVSTVRHVLSRNGAGVSPEFVADDEGFV